MYDIYDISLGQISRVQGGMCQPMCFVCSYMLVAQFIHVNHNLQGICVLGGHDGRASLEAVRCDHAKDLAQMSMYQDRSKIDPNAPSVERGFPHRA